LALVGLLLGFCYGFVPWFLTKIITGSPYHFPDVNNGKTPRDFGMVYQDVEFQSSDGIPLRGWYVPASGAARGTIVYCHGHNRARVEMLPEAAFAHGLGYNGVLFDMRHQGQSGGNLSTVGYQERYDVLGQAGFAI